MRYTKKRIYEWSDEIAYSVGLMTSDGCLQSDGRHLDLTSKDLDQLETFNRAIGRSLKVSVKKSGIGRSAYHIQFSDVAYYDFLKDVGLTPNKSKTIGHLKVPDVYFSHFLRGYFDGDGTTYAYFDPRWPSSYMFYIGFTGASITLLQYIRDKNSRLYGLKGSSIRKSTRSWNLVYGKRDARILFEKMYISSDALRLSRKYEKLKGFINTDNSATIASVKCASGEIW